MRITPLAVWASSFDLEDIKKAVIEDVQFTHPNQLVQEAVFIYCATIKYLLEQKDVDNKTGDEAVKFALDVCEHHAKYEDPETNQSVQKWIELSEQLEQRALKTGDLVMSPLPEDLLNCRTKVGWIQRAMVLSFYYLKRFHVYYD